MNKNNGWMSKTFAMMLLSAGGALLAGCYVDHGADEEEVIDEVESAFTEATCGTTAAPDANLTASVGCYGSDGSSSTSATYGEPLCTNGWLVTTNGSYSGATAKAYVHNASDIDSDVKCADTVTRIRRYPSGGGAAQEKTYHGSWSAPYGCVLVDTNGQQAGLGVTTGDRFVVQAYRQSNGAWLRVRLGITGPAC